MENRKNNAPEQGKLDSDDENFHAAHFFGSERVAGQLSTRRNSLHILLYRYPTQ